MADQNPPQPLRKLIVVCGDQLTRDSEVFDDFDPALDAVLMTEAADEATYTRQSKRRIAFFFTAMRCFARTLKEAGLPVIYNRIDDADAPETLAEGLTSAIRAHSPEEVLLARPGDYRVLQSLQGAANAARTPIRHVEERHFFTTPGDFAEMQEGRKRFILEDFYRAMRRRTGYLMDGDAPAGAEWNFDKENRESFGKDGPGKTSPRVTFDQPPETAEVIETVEARFGNAPGSTSDFDEPVTRELALRALDDFIENRLSGFGTYQDAMWTGRTTLNHSRLSAALNVKLLNPREVCARALDAYETGDAPINAVEGFIRQILGWREFIRGVYWTRMPDYSELNHLDATHDVPDLFWTGETEMTCLRDSVGRLIDTGYAHHIERLMVMGLFLLIYGARPYAVHEWHVGLYLDATDWVSLPNTLGMSQHGDGGIVGTKPYCASGSYIHRMSNYCKNCRFDPKQATGEKACPFTTLYWDFLDRHENRFAPNRRMKLQISNLRRKDEQERAAIRSAAKRLHASLP